MRDARTILPVLRRDLLTIAAAFAASLLLGWAINLLRPSPLAFPYQSREVRALAGLERSEKDAPELALPAVREAVGAAVFIDAREPLFFEEGHLPGAVNFPVSAILERRLPALPADRSRRLIVYCSGGDCEDSRIIARALTALGFENVFVFRGGWEEWTEARQ
jgi:rhodanese-related sulfurtransferase